VLPDDDHQAPRRTHRQQVQRDSLGWDDHRAEGTGEQQEREAGDQRDDQREVAVDRVEEVGALCRLAAGHGLITGRSADAIERLASGRGVAIRGRDDRDQRRLVAPPIRRCDRAADALDALQCRDDLCRVCGADKGVESRQRAGADAGVLQPVKCGPGRSGLGQ